MERELQIDTTFPLDSAPQSDAVIEEVPNDPKRKHEKATETFKYIAEQILELSIPEQTINNWKSVTASIKVIDKQLDHIVDKETRQAYSARLAEFLTDDSVGFPDDPATQDAMARVRDVSSELSENQRTFFFDSLKIILKITEKLKNEESVKKFADLTRLEGQLTAKLYTSFLPEEYQHGEKYAKLILVFTRLGRVANNLDSFIDLPEDHKQKQTKIEPTILNRAVLLGTAVSDAAAVLKNVKLSGRLIKQILLRVAYDYQNQEK